ncbi:hypothetical protein LguiB_004294 [Lonicera macranthoides]
MTPAAVDFRSPNKQRSQSNQPSPFQNPIPNPTFGAFASENGSQQDSNILESSNIGKVNDSTLNLSFNSDKSIPSGRSRPRLSKVRKHSSSSHHGRSNSVSAESDSVRNFFPSEISSRAKDSMANGFSGTVTGLQFGTNKFDNLGFVFGAKDSSNMNKNECKMKKSAANKSNVTLDSNMENSGGVSGVDEIGKFDSVGFGSQKFDDMLFSLDSNMAKSEATSSLKAGEVNENVETYNKREAGNKSEFGKVDNGDFVFGANYRDSVSSSNLYNKESSKHIGKMVTDIGGEMKLDTGGDSRKFESGGFAFGTGSSGVKSNSKLRHSASNADLKNKRNAGKSDFADWGKMNVDIESKFPKDKVNGVFIFGSGSKECFTVDGSRKMSDGMNKLKSKRAENCNGFMKRKSEDTGSLFNNKNSSVSGISSNLGSSFGETPIFSVSEKMQSLNIRDSGKVDGAEMATDCNINSCANVNTHMFVFGSNKKIDESNTKANLKKEFAFGKNEKNASTFGGSVENTIHGEVRNTDPGFGNSSSFTFGTSGKENHQPVNLTEESLDGTRYTGNQPNNDTQCNKASFPSSSSSMGFSFQAYSAASEAPPTDRIEKEKLNFAGFSTPNLNMPGSFTKNLFPDLSKKLEFSVNSRSVRERKSKKTRGKPRQHTLVQQPAQAGENHLSKESKSQQNLKSPECCSPMDFSPYQDGNDVPTKSKDDDLASAREGSNTERVSNYNWAGIASEAAGGGFCANKQEEETGGRKEFPSGSIDTKRYKKYRMKKTGSGSKFTTQNGKGGFGSLRVDTEQGKKVERSDSERKGETFSKADEEHVKLEPTEAATLEACQSWRSRGNQAYRNGDLSIAEDFYTKGINVIPHTKISGCFTEALVLCYSNRATTQLALGRMREALGDCRMASSLDPNFLKVHIRAANCHLVLGEVEDAIQYFSKCLESGNEVCLDRRITIEAAEGVQKAQKVIDCMNRSSELLKQKTSDAASNALGIIAEALSISCYSEKLLEMKGEALCTLRKYEEAVQLCERTLDFAEKNFAAVDSGSKNSSVRLWRWRIMSKSNFYLGRLDAALDFIEKQEQLKSINDRETPSVSQRNALAFYTTGMLSNFFSFLASGSGCVILPNAGNEAFQFGKHTEAVEHYTAAISSSVESRPFAAVCFCNRAAAHQALGQITDAIADCSLSIALDGNYTKALSRRATLHEMIRDYEQAVNDLQKLLSILEKQYQEKFQKSGTMDKPSGGSIKDLRRTRHRLSSMEEKARKGTPLDLYMILGIKASDPAAEIKKAYRKAALRHHPDKAGQFLARCEIGDDGCLYKEIAEKIHTDADRLFKMIGEAYAVLSDPGKRSKYDLQEEMRDDEDEYRSSNFGRASNFNSSPFESSNRRYWKESWKTYEREMSVTPICVFHKCFLKCCERGSVCVRENARGVVQDTVVGTAAGSV